MRQVQKLTGVKTLPTDIWIDARQRVRRQTVAISTQAAGADQFSLTIDYKRFGVPVDVQAPPADETVDYSRRRGRRLSAGAPHGGGERLLGRPSSTMVSCSTRPSSTQ